MEWIHDLILPGDTSEKWAARRVATEARIREVLGPSPDRVPPLEVEIVGERSLPAYVERKIEYTVEAGDRVRAFLLIPHELREPAPAVLCLHETAAEGKMRVMGMEGKEDLAYAPELAERGYVTLAPDIVSTGERVFPGAAPLDTRPFYERFPDRTVEAKNLWDHMRAVDLLRALPEADGARIGAVGHSLGGRSTHYLAAFDERVGCAVMSCGICPHASYYRLFRQRSVYDPLPTRRTYIETHNRLPYEKHELMALIAPRPLLIVTPANDPERRHDEISEMAHKVFEVYRVLGRPSHFARLLHGFGHNTPAYVREAMFGWLAQHLRRSAGKPEK